MGLWALARLVQIGSEPQYGEGCGMEGALAGEVAGSRTVSGTVLAMCFTGSSTGR
jgi:hypothetical protein